MYHFLIWISGNGGVTNEKLYYFQYDSVKPKMFILLNKNKQGLFLFEDLNLILMDNGLNSASGIRVIVVLI
jgi:hypothetical protein